MPGQPPRPTSSPSNSAPDSPRTSLPPLAAALRQALDEAADDRERISLLGEAGVQHAVEIARASATATGQHEAIRADVAEARNEASGAKIVAGEARGEVIELRAELRQYELRRRGDAEAAAERDGRLMAELGKIHAGQAEERAARVRQDSIHDEQLTDVKKRLTARQIATYGASVGTGVGVIEGLIYLLKHLP